eukprot:917111-Amphidinium_carterae.1
MKRVEGGVLAGGLGAVREPTNDGVPSMPEPSGGPQKARRPAHALHTQPRGQAVPQLIGEYRRFVELPCHETVPVGAKRRTLSLHPRVPTGSKLMEVNIGDGIFMQQVDGRKCMACGMGIDVEFSNGWHAICSSLAGEGYERVAGEHPGEGGGTQERHAEISDSEDS